MARGTNPAVSMAGSPSFGSYMNGLSSSTAQGSTSSFVGSASAR